MKLDHINQENCHHCGAKATHEYKSEKMHCNGTSEETRRFACGCVLRYLPNFEEVTETNECERSERYKKKESLMVDRVERTIRYMRKTLRMTKSEIWESVEYFKRNLS